MEQQQQPLNSQRPQQSKEDLINEVGEFPLYVGTLVAKFYKEYYGLNSNLEHIFKIKNINTIKEKESLYTIPIICDRIATMLRYSAEREKWAQMLFGYYANLLELGQTSYDAMKRTINLFSLKWDDPTKLPEIEFNDKLFMETLKITGDIEKEVEQRLLAIEATREKRENFNGI